MYKIRYTPRFDEDIDLIWEDVYKVSCSREIADKYKRDFILKIKKKQNFPQSGIPLYSDDLFTGYYYVHFKAYNAFYHIRQDCIELVRALPAKSDYIRILFGEYYPEDLRDESMQKYVHENDEE